MRYTATINLYAKNIDVTKGDTWEPYLTAMVSVQAATEVEAATKVAHITGNTMAEVSGSTPDKVAGPYGKWFTSNHKALIYFDMKRG